MDVFVKLRREKVLGRGEVRQREAKDASSSWVGLRVVGGGGGGGGIPAPHGPGLWRGGGGAYQHLMDQVWGGGGGGGRYLQVSICRLARYGGKRILGRPYL